MKEVLPEGYFHLAESRRPCSEDFIQDLSLGSVSYLVCTACNRVHFDGSPTSSLSRQRLAVLRIRMEQDSERYVEHAESFLWLELPTFWSKRYRQRVRTLFDCPCGFAQRYAYSTWLRGPAIKATYPVAEILWSPDGCYVSAQVTVTLPDGHTVTRPYKAELVSVDCYWGYWSYREFYLTNFFPSYKNLDILKVGLDPKEATNIFRVEYLNKAGWELAMRLHKLHSPVRLRAADWKGRRVDVEECTLPPHGVTDSSPGEEGSVREQILARIRAQQAQEPIRVRVELSEEEWAIAEMNRSFHSNVSELVEEIDSDNVW